MQQVYSPLCTIPFDKDKIVKHLLYYTLPLGGENEWVLDKNIRKVCEGIEQFNGKRIVTIAIRGVGDPNYNYISPDDVIKKFQHFGATGIEFLVAVNQKKLWEVSGFLPMLQKVMTDDPNHVFFYGHCKGVTHPNPALISHKWADVMYETVYNNWSQVKQILERFGTAGALKAYGEFKSVRNHRWYYSGTFYWVRAASAFLRNWTQVDQIFYGTESWPGLHFRPDEGGCILGDNISDMYKKTVPELDQLLNEWRQDKLNGTHYFKCPIEYRQEIIEKQYPCILEN